MKLFNPKDEYTQIIYDTTIKEPSLRVLEIADAFGIGVNENVTHIVSSDFRMPDELNYDVLYITGMSGSGKSSILREFVKSYNYESPILRSPKNKPIIDCIGEDLYDATKLLGLVGLGEAMLFLKSYNQLSDGQKYRFKLAKYLESKPKVLIIDEFLTFLDRSTAKIIAYNFQKICRKEKIKLIVATPHNDLKDYLKPYIMIDLRMGDNMVIKTELNDEINIVLENCVISKGTIEDYHQLSKYHYVATDVSFHKHIYKMVYEGMIVGVIVYSTPFRQVIGRNVRFGTKYYDSKGMAKLKEVNEDFLLISRVIIHPMFRGIGAGSYIIEETMKLQTVPYVELLAVMTKYNKFVENAGGVLICENIREDKRGRIDEFTKYLSEYGFDYKLISSEKYCDEILKVIDVDKSFKSLLYDVLEIKHTRITAESRFGTKKKFVANVKVDSKLLSGSHHTITEYYLFEREV